MQPPQFKLDPRLARMLGIHTQTRPVIIQALWQYVKTHKLQDPHEREFINCDKYLQQVSDSILFLCSLVHKTRIHYPTVPQLSCSHLFPDITQLCSLLCLPVLLWTQVSP